VLVVSVSILIALNSADKLVSAATLDSISIILAYASLEILTVQPICLMDLALLALKDFFLAVLGASSPKTVQPPISTGTVQYALQVTSFGGLFV